MLNYIGFTITEVRILGLQKHKSGWGSRYPGHGIFTPTVYCRLLDKQNRQLSDFNKICQNDLTRYCHNEIINLLFSKFKKLKMGGGQDTQATVSSPPGVIRAGMKIPREILTPGGQAARGYLDPGGQAAHGSR